MSAIIAIDPGPTWSAMLILIAGQPSNFGIKRNDELIAWLRKGHTATLLATVVIEKVESFGMAVGAEIFETVYWSGRFAEAARPSPVERIGRKAVKLHLCGTTKAKDSNIRQALIDRYGGAEARGTKKEPGPLYGIANDVWSALAVAVTYADGMAT